MSRTLFCLATIALLGALLPACATRTEVIIAVQSDIDTLDRITITVTSPTGASQSSMATFGTGSVDLVRTLGVTYSSGPTGPFVATASGFRSGVQVITRTGVFEFVPGQTRILRLDLLASCVGVMCSAQNTCAEGGCRPQMIQPNELEAYNGSVPSHDAAAVPDDMGTPGIDAGSDAGSTPVMCGGTTCDLANSTNPTCQGGRCTIGTCNPGFLNCDNRNSTGCEANGNTDAQHCGDCTTTCSGGTSMCCNGHCAATCP